MCVGDGEGISWRIFFFPKDQGQEESTPRVVGGKKNNKAHERLGSTTLLTSSVIISAWLGCLGNLHNAILTPSLQLSITTAVEPPSWCTLAPSLTPGFFSPVVCLLLPPSHLLARLCLFPRPSLYLCLFFFYWAKQGEEEIKIDFTSFIFWLSTTHRHLVNDEAPSQ